jgi:hypothetical protein
MPFKGGAVLKFERVTCAPANNVGIHLVDRRDQLATVAHLSFPACSPSPGAVLLFKRHRLITLAATTVH